MEINPPEKLEQVYNIRTTKRVAKKINAIAKKNKVKPSVLIRLILNDWTKKL